MPKNWKTYKLEDLTTKLGDGLHGTPEYSIDGEYYFINGNNLTDGKIEIKPNTKRVTEDQFCKYQKPLNDRTILVSINGTLGNVATYNNEKVVLGKSACYFNIKADVDKGYIKQLVSSANFRLFLESNATGSVIKNVSLKSMREYEVQLPPLPEQKAIASILSAVDDKIENNLAINNTLEDMAMALYKHWFVDFGPFQDGEFIDSELGPIPKGWEVKKIGDVIDTIGGGTPKTKEKSYWEKGDILWYSPTDLTRDNAMFSLDSSKKITELGLQKSSAKIFPPYSLLMSSRATIGALTINTKEASTNQGFITMIPNNQLSIFQLYNWTKSNLDLIISKANGSTFKEISKTNFRNLNIVIANDIDNYLNESKEIFNRIENGIVENQTLTKLRDTLLPKLISGEVRLKKFLPAGRQGQEQIETVL